MTDDLAERQAPETARCDVCRRDFEPDAGQRRCSEECRGIAREFGHRATGEMYGHWLQRQEFCPVSGKPRHQTKRAALSSARAAEGKRFTGFPGWLRVYPCDDCRAWHLTSKPPRTEAGHAGQR